MGYLNDKNGQNSKIQIFQPKAQSDIGAVTFS